MKPKTSLTRNPMSRSPLRHGLFLTALVLACFALSPAARAVDPPPDGGYPNQNTAEGEDVLFSLTTGYDNTAIGFHALYFNTTGFSNTANGDGALASNNTGSNNTATGDGALASNTTGFTNTAIGVSALFYNTTGINNTATGGGALQLNTTGDGNTATGVSALSRNTTGDGNTATGGSALLLNTTGFSNTATGSGALGLNTTGSRNTANGDQALQSNTTGVYNTATGVNALLDNTTGNFNTASGIYALLNNMTGSHNIALGSEAGANLTTGSNNIDIGSKGQAGESNTIRIGKGGTQTKTVIAGIREITVTGGVAVMIDANGRLGTVTSSARFKDNIKPMDKASEAILALKPVTFHYKREIDPDAIPQFGLVAEEVEKVNPHLVARDADGKAYTVRYEAVNAMLLNEFLKEHRKVEEQGATIARQQKQIEALTAGLQKVSAQIEASKSTPQMVLNSP